MEKKENCFIVMPLTTPDIYLDSYRDRELHFSHILECLIVPAVEKAGYNAIKPKAQGADIIQAEIIHYIEDSEMVLCDISSLNPNVFFEFGIRTSLNKPICVIKDNITKKVPFDTAIINFHEYDNSIEPWLLSAEILKISEHIKISAQRNKGENSLWKYFGFRHEAVTISAEHISNDEKFDYLVNKIEVINTKLQYISNNQESIEPIYPTARTSKSTIREIPSINEYPDIEKTVISDYIKAVASVDKAIITKILREDDRISVFYSGKLSDLTKNNISETISNIYQMKIDFRQTI
jgi:hypothetical protein